MIFVPSLVILRRSFLSYFGLSGYKVEIHAVKHFKSTKMEKTGHEKDKDKHKLDYKGHHDITKSGNLHKYIQDLIEKKIKMMSERIFD